MRADSSIRALASLLCRMKAYSIPYLLCLIVENAIGVGLNLVLAFVYMDLFAAVTKNEPGELWGSFVLFILSLSVTCVLHPLFRFLGMRSVKRVMEIYRNQAYEHLLSLPVNSYNDHRQGEFISRLTHDLDQVERMYTDHLSALLSTIFYGMGSIIALWVLNWKLAIGIIGWGMLSTYINSHLSKRLSQGSNHVQESQARLLDIIVQGIGGREVIALFRLKGIFQQKLNAQNETYIHHSYQLGKKLSAFDGMNYAIASLSNIGIYMVGAVLVYRGMLPLATLIAVTQLQHGVTSSFASMGGTLHQLKTSLSGTRRFFELFDYEPEEMKGRIELVRSEAYLAFENVSFGYGRRGPVMIDSELEPQQLLHNISFRIDPGSFVCLVGSSGSGKSTIMELLLQFQQSPTGEICLPDACAGEWNVERIRSRMAYVPQEPFLFAGTIEDNIRLGRPGASDEEIFQAAREADIIEYMMSLPGKLQSPVLERGQNLSGGQKQRIALARALLSHAPILLLDEVSSALDAQSEENIVQALQQRAHDRQQIVILITHRKYACEHADKVIYLNQGQITVCGK
ncbi:ABC transporter ATP-binding protein [Paenibacillus sp. FSL H7-0350]|uniref:ABC transporter ATP-binding protein n=1 Tax=Paenibacillus sp. FSL H7-0350 TaxID=2975345 RepID=UPI00315805D2